MSSPQLTNGSSALALLGCLLCCACGVEGVEGDSEPLSSQNEALHDSLGRSAWFFFDGTRIQPATTYNSRRLANTITKPRTGEYEVTLQGMGIPQTGENIQVSVVERLGQSAAFCQVAGVDSIHPQPFRDLHVRVSCYDRLGVRKDAAFYLSHVDYNYPLPSLLDPRGVGVNAQIISFGDRCNAYTLPDVENACERLSPGRYALHLTGPTEVGGTVQLTASSSASASHCNVERWFPDATGTNVFVNCFGAGSVPQDSGFYLGYRLKVIEKQGGFVWAHSPTASNYVPVEAYNDRVPPCFITPNHDIYVKTSTPTNGGEYLVTYPELGALVGPKVVHTTPYGNSSNFCRLGSSAFRPGDDPDALRTKVNCYNSAGGQVDTKFTQLLLVDSDPLCIY